jgi:hypothetical protein
MNRMNSLICIVPASTWLDYNVLLYIIAKVIALCDWKSSQLDFIKLKHHKSKDRKLHKNI